MTRKSGLEGRMIGGARRGAGRPSLGADARSVSITVKVTPAMVAELDRIAELSCYKRAELLFSALQAITRASATATTRAEAQALADRIDTPMSSRRSSANGTTDDECAAAQASSPGP